MPESAAGCTGCWGVSLACGSTLVTCSPAAAPPLAAAVAAFPMSSSFGMTTCVSQHKACRQVRTQHARTRTGKHTQRRAGGGACIRASGGALGTAAPTAYSTRQQGRDRGPHQCKMHDALTPCPHSHGLVQHCCVRAGACGLERPAA
jgi:hypothetical protein